MLTMLKSFHWAKVCVSYIQIFLTCVVNVAFSLKYDWNWPSQGFLKLLYSSPSGTFEIEWL